MKIKILLTTFIFIVTNVYSQTFSFKIIFKDNIGNKDSLIIGYDPNATDTIDSFFNETNIINIPLNSDFDVRISNLWDLATTSLIQTPFQTKKQILHSTGCWTNPLTFDIKCKNWPVTAYWDKSPFNVNCRNGSLLTSVSTGGWFDTGTNSSMGIVALVSKDSVTFTTNLTPGEATGFYNYLNNNGDTIPVFWFTFADSTIFTVGMKENENIYEPIIYPNPTKGIVNIPNGLYILNIIDLSGNKIHTNQNDSKSKIDLSTLQKGFYILTCIDKKEKLHNFKILRE